MKLTDGEGHQQSKTLRRSLIAVERFFTTANEDDRRLDFRVQGRHRVETHVGLVLIDRLLTALANRLDDPTTNLKKAKPW